MTLSEPDQVPRSLIARWRASGDDMFGERREKPRGTKVPAVQVDLHRLLIAVVTRTVLVGHTQLHFSFFVQGYASCLVPAAAEMGQKGNLLEEAQ
jgi:hypothetical protein